MKNIFSEKNILISVFCLIMVFSFFVSNPANAASTYYVATNGSDSNAGTESAPWKTIQKAMNSATAGSTVYIKGGTYYEIVTVGVNGTAGAYITFRNTPGETVVIDGRGDVASGDVRGIINVNSKNYLKFIGLHLTNHVGGYIPGGFIVTGASNNIEFRDGKITHIDWASNSTVCPGQGTQYSTPIRIMGGSNIIIDNNEVFNNNTGDSESITVDGNVNGFTISNNTIYGHPNIGIDVLGHGAGNQPKGGLITRNHIYSGSYFCWSGGVYIDGGTDTIIENNYIHDNWWGIEVGSENSYGASNIIVRNNIVFNNSNWGILVGAHAGVASNVRVYNNVIVNNPDGNLEINSNLATNSVFKNNIIYSSNGGSLLSGNVGGNVLDYNLWYSTGGGAKPSQDSHGIFVDPRFIKLPGAKFSATVPDFHPQSSSPAINAGTTLSEVTKDYDGVNRPVGSAFDIGAYEYGGIPGSTSPPPPTTTLKGDLNNDRIVNSLDWSIMNSRWFTSDSTADLNTDGIVNSLDFSIMNGNWLKSG
jgi:hypothetical protein